MSQKTKDLAVGEEVEPYTVLKIERKGVVKFEFVGGVLQSVAPGRYFFHIHYRTYTKPMHITVVGTDELEAYVQAKRKIEARKVNVDKGLATRRMKKEQENVCSTRSSRDEGYPYTGSR